MTAHVRSDMSFMLQTEAVMKHCRWNWLISMVKWLSCLVLTNYLMEKCLH